MPTFTKLILLLLLTSAALPAQEPEIDRLIRGELQMTFPSIYFKHKSTDYATMPYTVDSCFNYLALHFKDNLNSLVIWRDSAETEALSQQRIKKLKKGLAKYLRSESIDIHPMGTEQKVPRRILAMTSDSSKINYLLTLNSVFDISKTRFPPGTAAAGKSHVFRPKIWCWRCWKNGFYIQTRRKLRKMEKHRKQSERRR